VPVTTTDFPTSTCGRSEVTCVPKETPPVRSRSTKLRFASKAKKPATLAAIVGPMPSEAAMSSSLASMMRSRSPKAADRASATVPPTWRIPIATRRFGRGRVREASMAATRFRAEMAANPSRSSNCVDVNR
jgi:hypothetical protein